MSKRSVISTNNAPKAIGSYSQAVRVDNTVYISGQIPLDPHSMIIVSQDFSEQARQVFKNLQAICIAADASLQNIVKLNIFLTDMENFPIVNEIMEQFFDQPFPARAAVGVKSLPKSALIEADAILAL